MVFQSPREEGRAQHGSGTVVSGSPRAAPDRGEPPTGGSAGRAVFVGTARNCGRFLPHALARWSELETLFSDVSCLVAENHSTDDTKAILQRWQQAQPNRSVICMDADLDPNDLRSVNLACARNRLLDEIRSRKALAGADYLLVMDLDDASLLITARRLRRCMQFEGWDGLFANQLFYYNDVWALRHPSRSPDDFARRIAMTRKGWPRLVARLRYLTWRNRPILPVAKRPIPVRSAFGGLAVYRMRVALGGSYAGMRDGFEVCEHVPFNEGLSANGARLFIHPGLLNMAPIPRFILSAMPFKRNVQVR